MNDSTASIYGFHKIHKKNFYFGIECDSHRDYDIYLDAHIKYSVFYVLVCTYIYLNSIVMAAVGLINRKLMSNVNLFAIFCTFVFLVFGFTHDLPV